MEYGDIAAKERLTGRAFFLPSDAPTGGWIDLGNIQLLSLSYALKYKEHFTARRGLLFTDSYDAYSASPRWEITGDEFVSATLHLIFAGTDSADVARSAHTNATVTVPGKIGRWQNLGITNVSAASLTTPAGKVAGFNADYVIDSSFGMFYLPASSSIADGTSCTITYSNDASVHNAITPFSTLTREGQLLVFEEDDIVPNTIKRSFLFPVSLTTDSLAATKVDDFRTFKMLATITDPSQCVIESRSGAPPVIAVATTYTLSGPSSGYISAASTSFTVALPVGTTVGSAVHITPSAGGGGGTFSPTSVTLTTASPSATFTYTPASYGAKTISVTNDGGLTDPASLTYTSLASTYTLTGPSSGTVGVTSTNFTVALPASGVVIGTVTVTPHDASGGGTFSPTTVVLTTAAPSVTFTYTAASSGAKTISVTNNGGLTDPSNLTYTASAGGLTDGAAVSTWPDSSGNGHDATQSGSARPTFKTNIINGKPVVRFTSAGLSGLNLVSPISGTSPWTCFAVMKQAASGNLLRTLQGNSTGFPESLFLYSDNAVYGLGHEGYTVSNALPTAFAVLTILFTPPSLTTPYVNGTQNLSSTVTSPFSGNFTTLGYDSITPAYSNGDIAEVIFYSGGLAVRVKVALLLTVLITTGAIPSTAEADELLVAGDLVSLEAYLIEHGIPVEQARDAVTPMTVGDRANIEKYLGTKYAITVAGGSAVDPSTVAGLTGWWKADSLG